MKLYYPRKPFHERDPYDQIMDAVRFRIPVSRYRYQEILERTGIPKPEDDEDAFYDALAEKYGY